MEKYVTSLEISKKLGEAGFDVQTDFFWEDNLLLLSYPPQIEWRLSYNASRYHSGIKAYSFEQIWEELPCTVTVRGCTYHLQVWESDYIGYISETEFGGVDLDGAGAEGDLADAAAKLWLYLKESNLLK